MTKVSIRRLDSVTHNDTAATTLINDNFNSIQTALENTLSRDGTTPNFMDAELDMNGRRIINGAEAVEDTDYVTYGQIKEDIAGAAQAAEEAAASAAKADVSAQSASISAQTAIAATREAQAIKDYVDAAVLDENLITVAEDLQKGNNSEIKKVNSNKANIDTVADSIDDVTTVSSNIADVNTIADDIAIVNAVAADRTNIDTVAASIAAVSAVAAIDAAVVAVNANKDNINAVNNNKTNIDTVAGVAGDVTTVAGIASDVSAVADNETDIKAVAANRDNIVTVASSATDINKVASGIDSVATVAEDIMDVMTVAGISTQVQSVADNMSAVTNVSSIKDDVTVVAANKDAVQVAAENIDDIKEAANAKIWAEGTDPEVTGIGGTHSAKGWAELAGQLVGVGPATEDVMGLVQLSTTAEAKEGFDDSTAMTPLKTAQVVYDNVGRGIQLGFSGTLEGDTLTFETPDESPYTIKQGYCYEIDLLFQAAGILPDDIKVVIKNGTDTINIVNVLHDDFTKPITVGCLKQLMKYNDVAGWRWVFNSRFTVAQDGTKVFVMPSTVVNAATDVIYNRLHDALLANPDMIRYENDVSTTKILAGSTFVYPNGYGVYNKVTTTSQMSINVPQTNNQIIFTNGQHLYYIDADKVFAQDTAPVAYEMMLWYDTANNKIKYTGNSGTNWLEGYAFPFGIADNTGIVDCFCNGIGYFANCVWILDGVEVLIPNGKQEDGSFNNTTYTVTRPLVSTFDDTREGEWALGPSGIIVAAQGFEISEQNRVINKQTQAVVNGCPMGKFKTTTGRVNTLEVRSILDLTVADSAKDGGGSSGSAFNLFDTKWSDHLQNDASWLRADTFSWQSGAVYTAAYNELLNEWNASLKQFYAFAISDATRIYKLLTTTPAVGDTVYGYGEAYGVCIPCGSVTSVSGGTVNIKDNIDNGATFSLTRYTTSGDGLYAIGERNVIEGTTIYYARSPKGYNIVRNDQESAVSAIYGSTGVAWYYILDATNTRFKLPRNKYSFKGVGGEAGQYYGGTVPNISGTFGTDLLTKKSKSTSNTINDIMASGSFYGVSASGGTTSVDSTTSSTWFLNGTIGLDASRQNSAYKSGAAVQSRSVEMYLYFYVGNTVRGLTEVNVGALTELINDLDVTEAVSEITTAKNTAVTAVTSAGNTNVTSVNNAGISAITNIDSAKTDAITQINAAGEVISSYAQPIVNLTATSGTVSLQTNKIYTITVTGSTTFSLPGAVQGVFNQIKIMMKVNGTPSITWGTNTYLNKSKPTIEAGNYDIYYDWDNIQNAWYCGIMPKGYEG